MCGCRELPSSGDMLKAALFRWPFLLEPLLGDGAGEDLLLRHPFFLRSRDRRENGREIEINRG